MMTHVARAVPLPSKAKKAIRWPVSILIEASSSALGHHSAEIRDLSRTGCLIRMQCRFARNDLLLIAIPTFGPLAANVVWSDGTETGLKFVQALSPSVLETIAGRHRREGAIDF